MGKLKCLCGHLIIDQMDNLEYKGYIVPDVFVDEISENLTNNIDSLQEATKRGERLKWINKHFSPPYPTNLKDSSMIHDLLNVVETTQDIFECEKCGRIAIQVGQTHQFKFFRPESDDTRGILKGDRNSKK